MFITNKLKPLALGRPTTSDKYDVSGYTVAESVVDGIKPGAFLTYGTITKHYKGVGAGTTSDDIAGVALQPLVKSPGVWPAKEDVVFKPGEQGDCLIRGDVAVEIAATEASEPAEGGKVYLAVTGDHAGKVFTTAETGRIELKGFIFLGINGTDESGRKLAAVRKLY